MIFQIKKESLQEEETWQERFLRIMQGGQCNA
jgi:hypothetical protein